MAQHEGLTREWIERAVKQNTPVLYLHHNDPFMPCTAEWFMDRSELWKCQDQSKDGCEAQSKLLGIGGVSQHGLLDAQADHGCQRLELRLHPDAKEGWSKAELDEVPLYANVKLITEGDVAATKPVAVEINFITFYAHNGWYDVGNCGLWKVGAHDGDWEHFTVRLSLDGVLQGVWFNAHRPRDGCWRSAADLQWSSCGRFKVFVARHGHGTYPDAGRWLRGMMFANDATSARGAVWRPQTCIVLPEVEKDCTPSQFQAAARNAHTEYLRGEEGLVKVMRTPDRGSLLPGTSNSSAQGGGDDVSVDFGRCLWLHYKGKWGTIITPSAQPWFWTAETPVSRHPFLRACAQWWPETHKVD